MALKARPSQRMSVKPFANKFIIFSSEICQVMVPHNGKHLSPHPWAKQVRDIAPPPGLGKAAKARGTGFQYPSADQLKIFGGKHSHLA
jgi:hypothetical protein